MDTLGCGLLALKLPGVRQAARARSCRARRCPAARGCRAPARTRPGAGGLRHRRHDPLARFQRHLARGRMGPPVRQPRRHPRRRRTTCRARRAARPRALTVARRAHRHGPGARDPGRAGAENSFNRVGLDHVLLVRVASTAVVTAMLGGTREQIINARVERLGRRRGAAHVPPCPQHRLAQELGRRATRPAGRPPRADGAGRARWATRRR